MIDAARLREILAYDPLTGEFTWIIPRMYGQKAGSYSEGYIKIRIDKKAYRAHRVAWAHYYGQWPVKDVDHRDTNKSNNAIDNLRELTNAQNAQNGFLPKGTTAANLRGVSWHKHTKKWQARIMKEYKSIFLGYFDTPEEASAAYWKAKKEQHPHVQLPARR